MNSPNKKILLIGNIPPPFGGVPAHIFNLAPYLKEKGWDVYVLSSGYPKGVYSQSGVKVYKPTRYQNIVSILNPAITWKDAKSYSYLLKTSFIQYLGMLLFSNRVAKIIKTENIDLVSAYHLYAGLAAIPTIKKSNTSLVTTIFGEVYSSLDFYKANAKHVNDLLDSSSEILSCSAHCGKSIKKLGLSHIVNTHYYGVDTDFFCNDHHPSLSRKTFGWDENDKVIIFVGRMNEAMGLQTLLDSIPSLINAQHDFKFLICGANGPLTSRALTLEAQYPENIKINVDVKSVFLRDCYLLSDIAVAPSINDRACLGLAIIEAMSCKLPVVACDVGGTPEVITHNKNGLLIPPENPTALIETLISLTKNDELMGQLALEGRKAAVENFDIERANSYALKKFTENLPIHD